MDSKRDLKETDNLIDDIKTGKRPGPPIPMPNNRDRQNLDDLINHFS